MAFDNIAYSISAKSSGDMSSNQYKLVSLSTTNSNDGCILGGTTTGARATGVYQNDSTASEFGKVAILGISKVAVSTGSGPIVLGSIITTSTVGGLGFAQLATSTGGTQHGVGYAMAALASGSSGVIPVLLTPSFQISIA